MARRGVQARLVLALVLPSTASARDQVSPVTSHPANWQYGPAAFEGGLRWLVTDDPEEPSGGWIVASSRSFKRCVWRAVARDPKRGVPQVEDSRPFFTLSRLGVLTAARLDVVAAELIHSLDEAFATGEAAGVVVSLPVYPDLIRALVAVGFRVLGEEIPTNDPRHLPSVHPRWPVATVLGQGLSPAMILGRPNPNMLAQVRSLGRSGIPVHCLVNRGEPAVIARMSRYARKVVDVRRMRDGELIALIERLGADASAKPVLFFGGDYDVTLSARLWGRLAGKVRAVSHPPSADALNDKDEQCRRVAAAGVRVPRGGVIHDIGELATMLDRLRLPVICRPVELAAQGGFDAKIVVAYDAAALLKRVSTAFVDTRTKLLVQEYVPGSDTSLHFLLAVCDESGTVVASVGGRKLLQYPAGLMCCGETLGDTELEALGRRSFQALGVSGVLGVEFKRSADTGELFYIESNIRPENINSISEAAGTNLTLLAYLQTAGLGHSMIAMQPRPAHWRDASMEIVGRLRGGVGRSAILEMRRARQARIVCGAMWAGDDPLPALMWYAVKIYRLCSRATRGMLGRLTAAVSREPRESRKACDRH